MIWVGKQLKNKFGQKFQITAAPAPIYETDLIEFCKSIDYCSIQFYDSQGEHIINIFYISS